MSTTTTTLGFNAPQGVGPAPTDRSAGATPAQNPVTRLTLPASKDLRRELHLTATACGLTVSVYRPRPRKDLGRMLAYAHVNREEARVDVGHAYGPMLWLGDAAFDLSESDVAKVRETFPWLRVQERT